MTRMWLGAPVLAALLSCGPTACSDRGEPAVAGSTPPGAPVAPRAAIPAAAPSCDDVGDRVAHLARPRFADVPDARRASADRSIAALRKEVIDRCRTQRWTGEVRACMVKAETREALGSCEPARP